MEEIEPSKFQKIIHSIIDSTIYSHQPVLIRDEKGLLVKIVPFSEQESWLGCMRDKGKITGDIISPAKDTDNWKVISE